MDTEMTVNNDGITKPTVLYDGACRLCRGTVLRWHSVFEKRGIAFEPLQTPWARLQLGLAEGEIPAEMKLLLPGGTVVGGYRAIAYLLRRVWWMVWLGWLIELPVLSKVSDRMYRWLARNRTCLGDVCALPAGSASRHHRATTFFEGP